MDSTRERGRGLLWRWNPTLIPNTMVVIVMITLFLFQIATLEKLINT